MAESLQKQLSIDAVELVSGHRGEFSIWVGDRCVARKRGDDYPGPDTVVAAVRTALG